MTGSAIALMLTSVVIIWGGLAVSVTSLVSRGRREERDARAAASAAAHEHLRGGGADARADSGTGGDTDSAANTSGSQS
ncbi:methionine/alanine import family NSS transporter small subunit [Actinomyces sp. 2119]|uniref:Methionine/alanine import family NSS transporter small subunit n=1 Tax=Actinomyces lilanjuaniae TaxID=2321394 RepID=A0ABM6Z4L1_9ACTO|nr:methionine/alanine import family NSS transporter small subunit [Actinomyces lilanjuaniae]RJF42476.1 methionine/alanine import family NSS transporter small subunit [Actinomyces sp. 2119]